ncbi:MAG: cyclodeaminase/cyclohydrolase family protein, partial [Thermoplasmata archaeon]
VWSELKVPVYLYADAARRPERRDLAAVRHGEFEGIRATIATDLARAPDVGEPAVHPTAGIVAIGARPVLIAFNAYLTTPDVRVAKEVARALRARDGGLREVKALGFEIRERGRAQVSMNLTDYRKTPVHRALEMVRREAARFGVGVEESEVVGLIPEDALLDAAEFYLQLNRFERANILERKVRDLAATPPEAAEGDALVSASLGSFVDRLAARTPTPGGGSAAAAAGAMGVALGEMALAFSSPAEAPDRELAAAIRDLSADRRELLGLVDRDTHAYEAVRAARRELKLRPADPTARSGWVAALTQATEVPLETARLCERARRALAALRPRVKPTLVSDLETGAALLLAGRTGALANATINLEDLTRANVAVAPIVEEIRRLSAGP